MKQLGKLRVTYQMMPQLMNLGEGKLVDVIVDRHRQVVSFVFEGTDSEKDYPIQTFSVGEGQDIPSFSLSIEQLIDNMKEKIKSWEENQDA